MPKKGRAGLHKQMVFRLFVIVLAMFVFGYALVPIYRAVCEITGVNVLTQQNTAAADAIKNTQVNKNRTIEIIFDGNERGSWHFRPEKHSLMVHPGEISTMKYIIKNNLSRDTQGQAIPSYLPKKAAAHFHKLECFCFKQQPFKAQEEKTFPVVFVVDNDLPKDVTTITLSYTFFEVGGAANVRPAED